MVFFGWRATTRHPGVIRAGSIHRVDFHLADHLFAVLCFRLAAVELPRTPLNDALTIPVSAILAADGDTFVFRYADGNLQRRLVALGPRVGNVQVVQSGVQDGDHIVARDVAGLSDGQAVTVTVEAG